MSRIFKIAILGAPASGKGTISSRIIEKFAIKHISSGDLLRLHVKNGTTLGQEAHKYMNEGKLVPDQFMIQLIMNELENIGPTSWLLDGFPRTKTQAEQLWKEKHFDFTINLDVPFNVILDRIRGRYVHLSSGRVYNVNFNAPKIAGKDDITGEDLIQREDDNPEALLKRLEIYSEITKPVIDFYKSKGILYTFHGKTTNEIWPQIEEFLAQKIN